MDIEKKLNEYAAVVGFVCPAEFWPALGYEGEARYVAIWWERCGDEASWSDGRSSVVGASWPAYQKLIEANFALGHPARWLLGSSETAATMWLIIDRMTEWAWLTPVEEAAVVLRRQWKEPERPATSLEEWMAAIDEAMAAGVAWPAASVEELMDEVDAALARQYERDEAFAAALRARRDVSAEEAGA